MWVVKNFIDKKYTSIEQFWRKRHECSLFKENMFYCTTYLSIFYPKRIKAQTVNIYLHFSSFKWTLIFANENYNLAYFTHYEYS